MLIGNTEPQTIVLPVDFTAAIDATRTYRLRMYDSERRDWEEQDPVRGSTFGSLPVSIQANGFRLIELQLLPPDDGAR